MEAEERKTAMSHDEMQDYWKTLCSFTGEDIPNEVNQLMEKIHYPRFLYKYRAVNNNNLDALRSNKLFFSKASSYLPQKVSAKVRNQRKWNVQPDCQLCLYPV